jgi:hypothetical protein
MKKLFKFLSVLAVATVFAGCTSLPRKAVATEEEEVEVVALNIAAPSEEEADLIVITHIKKRLTEEPYTFIISIDGKEIEEAVKGNRETESNITAERGEGSHYILVKRLRLKPESYEISLNSEDGHAVTKRTLTGGNIYTVVFDPVYGPRKFARPKDFREGVIGFHANFAVGKLMN